MRPLTVRRSAFSLLEMVLAVVFISAITFYSMYFLDRSQTKFGQRDCDAIRQNLQSRADRYFMETGLWPDRHLLQIAKSSERSELGLTCPAHGGNYRMSGAIVICPTHESTRCP